MVVSAFEEQEEKNKPDPNRQYDLSLVAKLTFTNKKRIVSSEPVDEKTLRDKYAIMIHMWLLGQMKHPGRSIYRDFDRSTFMDFLERLFDEKNFNLHKEAHGTLLLVPKWTYCMSYEYELHKEAHRLCREEGFGIKAALWSTIDNTEHRVIHWPQLTSIANSRSGGGDNAALERKEDDLQREARGRSRSPRRQGGNRKPKALPAPSQKLALTDGPKTRSNFRQRNKNGAKQTQNKFSGSSKSKGFSQLIRAGDEIRQKFFATDRQQCLLSLSTESLRQKQHM